MQVLSVAVGSFAGVDGLQATHTKQTTMWLIRHRTKEFTRRNRPSWSGHMATYSWEPIHSHVVGCSLIPMLFPRDLDAGLELHLDLETFHSFMTEIRFLQNLERSFWRTLSHSTPKKTFK